MTASAGTPTDERLLVEARFRASIGVTERFFAEQADRISRACLSLAERFERGGRLLVFGVGAQATDAHHVSVEFVHPVLVGKRALPAIALTTDAASLTGVGRSVGAADVFARLIGILGKEADIALGISRAATDAAVVTGLAQAASAGMLTLALAGGANAEAPAGVDFGFVVPTDDAMVVQEVQETLYHVMWELVHVFFERGVVT